MGDKRFGQVKYAVLQLGSFLGVGSDNYPPPGLDLEYDEDQG
jgi:hypothetical protein